MAGSLVLIKWDTDPQSAFETACPVRADHVHCECWWDGESCCACKDRALTDSERVEQGGESVCIEGGE